MVPVKILFNFCAVGLIAMTSVHAFTEAQADAVAMETVENVVFGVSALSNDETIDRVMDVHTPKNGEKVGRPSLILLHGNPGDKPYPGDRQHGFRDIATYFTQRGYVCFVVAWDLQQGHDKAFAPIEMAVIHIRENAARYGVAPNRIGVLGGSYGSRQGCTLATANFVSKKARVQACVMWAGGMSYPADCDKDDAPILLTYGTADRWYVQVKGILENLNRGNVCHAYFELKDGGHCFPMETILAFDKKQIEIIEDFLAIHLMAKKDTYLKMLHITTEGKGRIEIGEGPSYGMYPTGSRVTITALPAPGYQFLEWREDIVSKLPKADVLMNSNKQITAAFTPTAKMN